MIYNNFKLKKACCTHWMDISNVPPINVFVHAEQASEQSKYFGESTRTFAAQFLMLRWVAKRANIKIEDYRELEVQNEMTF